MDANAKLIVLVETDSSNHYLTIIDNLSGDVLVHAKEYWRYEDNYDVDKIIGDFAKDFGREILRVVYL